MNTAIDNKKILLIDDEEDIRDMLSIMISRFDYHTITAEDYNSAKHQLTNEHTSSQVRIPGQHATRTPALLLVINIVALFHLAADLTLPGLLQVLLVISPGQDIPVADDWYRFEPSFVSTVYPLEERSIA